MINQFSHDLACKYGLDVSVFTTGLFQAISEAASVQTAEILRTDGLTYAPFTLKDLGNLFPWWTRKQVQLVKKRAVESGLVKQDHFEANPMDRRLWYAVDPVISCEQKGQAHYG